MSMHTSRMGELNLAGSVSNSKWCSLKDPSPDVGADVLGILLLPGFSLLSLSSFVSAFHHANQNAGQELFTWQLVGADSRSPVVSSTGIPISVDVDINTCKDDDGLSVLVLIGGERIESLRSSEISSLLRRRNRYKLPICAIGTATWLLADAGILRGGMRCTIHASRLAAFAETFPDLVAEDCLFVHEGSVTTCAGDFAAFDLAAEMVDVRLGGDLASRICGQLTADRFRTGSHCQSVPPGLRHGTVEKLVRAIKLMEKNVAEPLPLDHIAKCLTLSRRQVERLFAKHMKTTPMQYYSTIRLQRARQLLEMTDMPVIEVAIACGYVSSSHFSKSFKDHFRMLPSHTRPWASG
ncbi:helix-turn-helix domain-containing protein [Mesorhizobium sp. Cs1299R1N1]|uniref:GlxA family transcriptional regulator n=1 Tax=Mesorhizobium sp. Cs1299R1N1 TaxID=3015172 RepID=UPI00301E1F9D